MLINQTGPKPEKRRGREKKVLPAVSPIKNFDTMNSILFAQIIFFSDFSLTKALEKPLLKLGATSQLYS